MIPIYLSAVGEVSACSSRSRYPKMAARGVRRSWEIFVTAFYDPDIGGSQMGKLDTLSGRKEIDNKLADFLSSSGEISAVADNRFTDLPVCHLNLG